MKQYGLVSLLLFCGLPGFGQGRDTVFAVHKLFAQKRGSGAGWVATGAEVAYDESVGWRAIGSKSNKATAATVHGGIPMVVGTWQMLRFSAEREATVIKSYQEGWSIPADIRSRLRRKHFRLTASDLSKL